VLLNRAPSLHRLSIQAFQPVLIEGRPSSCTRSSVRASTPTSTVTRWLSTCRLSDAAQEEARDIMAANKNLLKPADGSPILHIEQDIVLGCYYLTYDRPGTEEKARPPYSAASTKLSWLRQGQPQAAEPRPRAIPRRSPRRLRSAAAVQRNLPEDFPFQDEPMTKKRLQKVMADAYQQYGQEKTAEIADDLKDLGFYYATASGLSMGMGDFHRRRRHGRACSTTVTSAPLPFLSSTSKASLPKKSATA
jgi:DNA-directed RNA polymerase subunit beta'